MKTTKLVICVYLSPHQFLQPCIVLELYDEVIKRHVNMGANEFLRDFRRDWHVRKTIAHRNMVMLRKEDKMKKGAKVTLPSIIDDCSEQKVNSHRKLQCLKSQFGAAVLWKLYTRQELCKLCASCGLTFNTRSTKAQLGAMLANALDHHTNVPYPWQLVPLSQLQAEQLREDGRVGIRIFRQVCTLQKTRTHSYFFTVL